MRGGIRRESVFAAVVLGLGLLAGCQSGPSPKDEALAQGGRVLTPDQVRTLVVGKTLQGENKFGSLTSSFSEDGQVQYRGGVSGTAAYQITEAGEVCFEPSEGKPSCQVVIETGDGYSFFDETGA